MDKQLATSLGRKRYKFVAIGVVFLLLGLFAVVLLPARVTKQIVEIRVSRGIPDDQGRFTIMVLISNAIQNTVIYDNGPILKIANLVNGIWETNVTGRSMTGQELLKSGASRRPIDISESVPPNAKCVRVGLDCTSFSWRGRLAWRMRNSRFLSPVSELLLALDRSSRSRTEWSESLILEGAPKERQGSTIAHLSDLLARSSEDLQDVDIARMNLLCSQGLTDTDGLDVNHCCGNLEEMANRIRSETERHFYRFKHNPAEFENSEGCFRMLLLTVVLAEDFKVGYDPARKAGSMTGAGRDVFFADPSHVFLHGLLGSKRQGTCSSMPVLYVAIGRRLGYPLKLVTTKGHLFVCWDGAGERFNVEATSRSLNRFTDDYYRHWPFEISATEEAAEGYLKSLSPSEELAVFLSIRGMCLREADRMAEAAECFAAAAKHAPGCASYRAMAEQLRSKTTNAGSAGRT